MDANDASKYFLYVKNGWVFGNKNYRSERYEADL